MPADYFALIAMKNCEQVMAKSAKEFGDIGLRFLVHRQNVGYRFLMRIGPN